MNKPIYCTQNNGKCASCSLTSRGKDCHGNPVAVATIRTNANSAYGKWVSGWRDGGGWQGESTVSDAFSRAQTLKAPGVSWYMLGHLMASEQAFGRAAEARAAL